LKLDCGGELKELEDARVRYRNHPNTPFLNTSSSRDIVSTATRSSEVPETIGNCHFGIRFLLYIPEVRLPEEKIATLLNETYDAHVSVGTVVHYLKKLQSCSVTSTSV